MYTKKNSKSTTLLSAEENKEILYLLGPKCASLVTTVIQLYHTSPPDHSEWIYKDCGVLCLVKDSKRRKYFFRLYCLVRKTVLWEYQIQKGMEYTCPRNFFSSFEGDDCVFAFNFACVDEAGFFNASVLERISKKMTKANREKKKAGKLSKRNISMPIEPQHNFHVGFKNMEILKMSPSEIESYFQKKNINKKVLIPKLEVAPSFVAPIVTFAKTADYENQAAASPKVLKSHPFLTFQDNQDKNSYVEIKYVSAPNTPLLPRINPTTLRKAPPKPSPKPLKPSASANHLYRSHDLPQTTLYEKPQNEKDELSIDASLAILDEISGFLTDVTPQSAQSISHVEDNQISRRDNELKSILKRRVRIQSSSDDGSGFDTDDDWDN